ncbi:MAG TPA: hypothetical protein VID51_05120 [Solirubrobacterales bacterium]|jgi:hypothetical protein
MTGCRCARIATLAVALALAATAGCGDGEGEPETSPPLIERSGPGGREGAGDTVAPSHCPPELPSCRTAEGRIVFVERVDPDGDGDAHFVIVDPEGITGPGLTAIDVRKGLRPDPLPGPGDLISAAGPVQTGSFDQSQIHALELHVGR